MPDNMTYVQRQLDLRLNRDVIWIADRFIEAHRINGGIEVLCEMTNEIDANSQKDIKAVGIDELCKEKSYIDSRLHGNENKRVICISYRFAADDTLRVTVNPAISPSDLCQRYSCIDENMICDTFNMTEDDGSIYLTTGKIQLVFDKSKVRYSIYTNDGKEIFSENNTEKSVYFGYISPPLGCTRSLSPMEKREDAEPHKDVIPADEYCTQSFNVHMDEDFYGFGEKYDRFNRKGIVSEIWNVDPANTMGFLSYANIPFFISTRGYGFLLNSCNKSIFDMGSKTAAAFTVKVRGEILDYLVIIDSCMAQASMNHAAMKQAAMKRILGRYHDLTGRPALPPKWSFGLWMSRIDVYKSQEVVLKAAEELRRRQLPVDVLHIDPPWLDDCKTLVCNYTWGSTFNDHKEMLKKLKEQHFKLSLWICPYIPASSDMYRYAAENGYFVKDTGDNIIVNCGPMNWWSEQFSYIDFTNSHAEAWFKTIIKGILCEGVDVIKTDLGELGPEEALYHNGMDGKEGHNFYCLEYQRIVYEATAEANACKADSAYCKGCADGTGGVDNAMIWCRSGFTGSQKYPVHWAGDVRCDYENMAGQLRAILSAGMSGFVFFSHDIGGFIGTPTPALFTRWLQFGVFTSHSRIHGSGPRYPWEFGETADRICRKYIDLRYSLIPHIFSSAAECCIKGEPMVKAMVLEYPDDPTARHLDKQYIFCDDFLAAPVFKDEGTVNVYLPAGEWMDYWTGKSCTTTGIAVSGIDVSSIDQSGIDRNGIDGRNIGGNWISMYCNLETLPLFVKKGCIILKTRAAQYIGTTQCANASAEYDDIVLEIYPDRSGSKRLYYTSGEYGTVSYETIGNGLYVKTDNIKVKGGITIRILNRDNAIDAIYIDGSAVSLNQSIS